jgi:hypothetical protein
MSYFSLCILYYFLSNNDINIGLITLRKFSFGLNFSLK